MIAHTVILILGVYWLAAGAGLLANPERMSRLIGELQNSPALTFLTGVCMLFASGALLSIQHNFTTLQDDLATFFAGAALIEAILLIAWPKPLWAIANWMMPDDDHLKGFGLITISLGLVVFVLGAV